MSASPLNGIRAVLFDLDGTLLDSYHSHYHVFSRIFAHFGMPFDEATYGRHYSPNWYLFYERLGLPKDRWEEADRLWLRCYEDEAPQSREGADEVLSAVRASGREVGLVTSGDRSRVEHDISRMGWKTRFDVVVCGGDVPERKPHPGPLNHALRLLRIAPAAGVYVGDTAEDVTMGKAAGVTTAAVLGGFSTRDVLERTSPDLLLPSLRDLESFL